MPRNPRINLEGALYYITSRAIEGMNLFDDKEDFHAYIELLARYKNQHGFRLFAFSLMNAHAHLLVELKPDTTLSEIMHNITSAYTKYYNKKHNRQGHLFRGRYRATLVEKEPYLLKLTRYVHLNAVRSGLAQDPGSYPYSSYLYYAGRPQQPEKQIAMRQDAAEALAFLKDKSYDDYLKENAQDEANMFHRDLQRKLFIGSEEFGRKVEACMSQAKAAGDMEDIEEDREARPSRFVVPIVSGVVVAALAGSFLLYTQKMSRKPATVTVTQTIAAPAEAVIPFDLVGLDGSMWQIKFVAGTPFQTVDNLTFKDKKVSSENLGLNGYGATNYSMTKQESRVIWETMQTSDKGTASWRGEVQDGKMRGVLSLRPKGVPSGVEGRQGEQEPLDFSFVSLKYAKAK